MFDISEKLIVGQSDEIFGVSPINWDDSSWKQLSLVNDEEVISLSHAKVYVFSDSVLCHGKVNQNPTSNNVWEEKLDSFKDSPQHRTLDTIDGGPVEFEWNIFPGFTTLQHSNKVQEFMTKMSDPDQFQGRIIFMAIFNDIIWGSEDKERECIANATLVTIRKKIPSRTMVIPRTWIRKEVVFFLCWQTTRRMGQSRWESGHPVFRATSPLSRGTLKSKGGGQLSRQFCADGDTIEPVFFTQLFLLISSLSTGQSQICVMNTVLVKQERGAGQSDPLFEPARLLITTPTPSTEVSAQEKLLQKYQERV